MLYPPQTHCIKSVRIRGYSGPNFPAFGLNTDQNSSEYGHFSRSDSVFDINNPHDLKLFTRLRLGLSHLRYHKFGHNFQDCINAICDWNLEIEATIHFLLNFSLFQSARQLVLINIKKIDERILRTLLHGDKYIISSTTEFIVSTERFSNSLVWTIIFNSFMTEAVII